MKQVFTYSTRLIFAVVALMLMTGLATTAWGQTGSLKLEENFSYTAASNLTSNGWTAQAVAANPQKITSFGLTYAGYASSGIGNASYFLSNGEDDFKVFSSFPSGFAAPGSYYYSLLVRIDTARESASDLGDYFFHLEKNSSTFTARVFTRKNAADATKFAFGIARSSAAANISYSDSIYSVGTTYLVVVKYTIIAGATNDTCALWINPALGGSETAPTLTELATDKITADADTMYGVQIRQGAAAQCASGVVDGIRVGTTWEDVTASPAAPTCITGAATSITTTSATLNGTVNANWASTVVTFDYGTTLSYGTTVTADQSPVIWATNTATSKAITGLTPNQLYHFRDPGTNSVGTTNGADATFTTVPDAPVTTAGTSVTATSFTANWGPGSGNPPATYTLEVATDVGFSSMVSGYNPLAGISGTSQSVTGLSAGTTYYYRVRGVDVGGTSANSNTTSVITVPGAPTATTATGITPIAFTANWTSPGGTVTGYRLDVATDIGFSSFVSGYNDVAVAGTSDAVTGLSQSTTYYYRVRAVNGSGTGDNSNTITTTTQSSSASSNSDIVTFGSEATTISSLINDPGALSFGTGIQVWKFRIRDGGGSADADGFPTQLLAVTITQDAANEVPNWSNALLAADLFLDSLTTPHLASGTISATSISFTGFVASAGDDGTKDVILRISLKNPLGSGVADHQNFAFKITSANVTSGDFSVSSQFASFAAASSDNTKNEIEVIATKLAFTTQPPASAQTSTDLSTAVSGTDANGNIDPDYSGSVTLARNAGTGGFYAVSTLTHSTVAGTASWTDLRYNTVEAGVTIDGTGSLTTATSNAITFTPIVNTQSDVLTNNGEAATISSVMNDAPPLTSAQGTQVWSITVRDGGAAAPDSDALPTLLTAMTLTQDTSNTVPNWATAIRAADLFDGTTHLDSGEIGTSNIVFAGFSASAPDNGTKDLTVRISLKNPLPAGSDGKKFGFKVNPADVTAAGGSTSSLFNGSAAIARSNNTQNVIDVTASKLLFVANILNTKKDSAFTASARATDANGNTDVGFGNPVTFLKAGGPGTLTGNAPVAPVNGVATSTTLKIDTGGKDTLSANAAGVTSALSNSFVIIAQSVFKVAAGPSNVPLTEGPMSLLAVDTLAWDSVSTWQVVSGFSLTGIPHSLDSVVLDHAFRATAYIIRLGPTINDSCAEITIGYPGNVVPVGVLVPPKNRAKPAFWFGNGKTGNYDMTISGGGTFYDNKDTAGSATNIGGNVVFNTLSDSMKIETGGLWYHSSPAFNTMHRILSRKVDGNYGTVEFDVDVSHYTGVFDASGGGNYYYPNVVFSNTHGFSTYFWFGSGATTIHGNLTINPGAKDSMMLTGYPFLVMGNIINNGTIVAPTSPLVFAGTSVQTVSGTPMSLGSGLLSLNPAGANFLSDVNVTGGTVQTTGTYTYDSSGLPTNVTRNVVGIINMGTSTMFLNTAGSMNEGSNPVQGNVSATRTVLQNVNQTFGSMGYEINAAGGAPGVTTILRKTGAGSTSTGNGHQSIKRYFDVTPTNNIALNATVGFTYSPTELNGIVEGALLLHKSTNAGTTWTGQSGSVNTGIHKITAPGVGSFSRWTAASVDSPMFVTHTITIRKYADADGNFGTAGDETLKKWRFALYKDSVSAADSIAGGNPNGGVLTVPNLAAGTYIAVEGDSTSFGWNRLGKVHHGVRVATTTRYDTIVVSGGVSDSVDFINQQGAATDNSITIRKFKDSDGNFNTTGDRTAKVWYLELRDTSGTLLGSTTDTALTVSSLAANQYVVNEADSTGWVHLGYVLNGIPVAGTGNSVSLSLSGAQHGTLDFVNAPPSYSQVYRSFRPDSIANDKDNKGKVGKFVKRKADKADFIALFVDDTATVSGLHVEFGNAILLNYPFFTTPPSTHVSPDGKNKKWDFTFTSPVHHGDTVLINGFGDKGKVQKVGKYFWENGVTIVGTKKKNPVFTRNDPKNPMPNRVNALFETFAQTGFGANGLLIGRDRTADSAKQYGWILAPKYTDAQKSLKDKTGLHTGFARGFDKFTSNDKPILKRQKSIPPAKQNNMLIADMIALRLNIASSTMLKTPLGFGELIFSDTAANPYNGLMVKEIAAKADTMMMGRYQSTVHVFVDTSVFRVLDQTIQRINSAFEGAIDTIDFAVKLHLKGTKKLADVPYLHANPSVVPALVIPLDKPIVETPQAYKLYQNYPNPFNPTTTIQFDLMDQSVVTLKIYNILGQEVATLLDHAILDDGTQEVEFNATNFASGVYFYRLISESIADPEDGIASQQFMTVKKMLLIK
jgi:fibronectin type III domain protein/type IX secretion system substrate protein